MKNYFIELAGRKVGPDYLPLIIAEIGINHEGMIEKAINMIDDAHKRGCECVKFQTHVIEDEMIPNKVVPGNSKETIWEIMKRCSLTKEENIYLKKYVESKNMIYFRWKYSFFCKSYI